MKTMTRRQFIHRSGLGLGAACCLSGHMRECSATPLGLPIGFQVYPLREALAKDFPGTLRQMAELGYRTVEMCSPPGYVSSGFGPLAKLSASEIRRTIEGAGLHCESCHYSFQELKEHLDERIAFARELGLKQMIASGFWLKPDATMTDWMRSAEELNRMGERTKQAGIQLGFHNHHFEFKKLDGVLIYDALMGKLDPELIKMQFQVAVISLGYEAATFFKKYPGRFISLHLSDWSSLTKKAAPIGQGAIDWKQLFDAAPIGGVKNYFVEMNFEAMKASYPFLRDLTS